MDSMATVHLPPQASSEYVRIKIDGDTVGYLHATFYDQVIRQESEFLAAMAEDGVEEEAHSKDGRWVVRRRGEAALRMVHRHLAHRD